MIIRKSRGSALRLWEQDMAKIFSKARVQLSKQENAWSVQAQTLHTTKQRDLSNEVRNAFP